MFPHSAPCHHTQQQKSTIPYFLDCKMGSFTKTSCQELRIGGWSPNQADPKTNRGQHMMNTWWEQMETDDNQWKWTTDSDHMGKQCFWLRRKAKQQKSAGSVSVLKICKNTPRTGVKMKCHTTHAVLKGRGHALVLQNVTNSWNCSTAYQ